MTSEPAEWAGAWFDTTVGRVVVAVPKSRQSAAPRVDAAQERLVVVQRSFADLRGTFDKIVDSSDPSGPINGVSIDFPNNRVVIMSSDASDSFRQNALAKYGESVAVRQVTSRGRDADGPDRWRDRFPYWGGIGYHLTGTNSSLPGCSGGFVMRPPTGGDTFIATAGHCLLPSLSSLNPQATLSSGTAWTNNIGSSTGLLNSLCTSTGSSCDMGGTKWGDIATFRVSGGEGRIYTGGSRGVTSSPVVSSQTGLPAVGASVCVSGARTGVTCGHVVQDNFIAVRNGADQLRSPVVLTSNSGTCINNGDSGAPAYITPNSVRATGIVSGFGYESQPCGMIYTSMYYVINFFGLVAVM